MFLTLSLFAAIRLKLNSDQASHPVGDGGSMSLHEKGRGERRNRDRTGHDRGAEGGDKQGAAVIPICLPLCCAAPCVIM